jgi:hypothetical protein
MDGHPAVHPLCTAGANARGLLAEPGVANARQPMSR